MPAVREDPARALALIYHDPAFAGAFSLYWTPESLLHQNVAACGYVGYLARGQPPPRQGCAIRFLRRSRVSRSGNPGLC